MPRGEPEIMGKVLYFR